MARSTITQGNCAFKRLQRLSLVWLLLHPEPCRRFHLCPLAVRFITGDLQESWLIFLRTHPERARVELHRDRGSTQALDPFDRYRKIDGLAPLRLKKVVMP